jgi:hypothetical protein
VSVCVCVYIHTKFHMCGSSVSLIIAYKTESQRNISHDRHIIILHPKKCPTKCCIYLNIHYYASFPDPKLNVPPSPQLQASASMLLLTAGNQKARRWGDFLWHSAHTKFCVNPSNS